MNFSGITVAAIALVMVFAGPGKPVYAQGQTTTVKTHTAVKPAQPNPMAELKQVGDNLDTSMKSISANVHKKLDEGQKNTARTTKQMEQSPAGRDLQKAGNDFGKEVKGFGDNLGKKMNASLPKKTVK